MLIYSNLFSLCPRNRTDIFNQICRTGYHKTHFYSNKKMKLSLSTYVPGIYTVTIVIPQK